MLAVGTRHGVHLIDAATGNVRWEVEGGQESRATMSPDGRFVASVSRSEEYWKLWNAASGVLCMTGARQRNRNVQLPSDHERIPRVPRSRMLSTSAHCGIGCGGILAVRTEACHRRLGPRSGPFGS